MAESPSQPAVIAAPDPAPTALTPRPAVALGLIPATIDEAWRLATIMSKSAIVPKAYAGKPEDVLVAMMYGAELGLTPAQALTGIAVINGRPGLFGEALLAVIVSSPLYVSHDEYYLVAGVERADLEPADFKDPKTAAVCLFTRRGGAAIRRQFSIADATRAHLIGKAGPWLEYPQIMLRMRARCFAARDAFPDLLRGIRTAEELRDTPPAAVEAFEAPIVRRISDPTPAPPAPERRALEPAGVTRIEDGGVLGAIVTLASGVRVLVTEPAVARALAAFVGTDHKIGGIVTRGEDDELYLETYTVAE